MQEQINIKIKVREAKRCIKWVKPNEKNKEGFYAFNFEEIDKDSELEKDYYEPLSNILHNSGIDENHTYNWLASALDWIDDNSDLSIDELQDLIYEAVDSEVDVYTSNLTEWLASSEYNVDYLTQAIENGAKDGFQVLQMAQHEAIYEIFSQVLDFIADENG